MDIDKIIMRLREFIEAEYMAEINLNKPFIEIDFNKLLHFDLDCAEELLDNPKEAIKCFQIVAKQINDKNKELQILIKNLPESTIVPLNEISNQIDKFLTFEGNVVRQSDIYLRCVRAKFECGSCGNLMNIVMPSSDWKEPSRCLPKGTLVWTTEGLKPIEKANQVICLDYNGDLTTQETKIIKSGLKTVWKINDSIECSEDHLWFVYRDGECRFIPTKDLNTKDVLIKINENLHLLWDKISPISKTVPKNRSRKNKTDIFRKKNLFRLLQSKTIREITKRKLSCKCGYTHNNEFLRERKMGDKRNIKKIKFRPESDFRKIERKRGNSEEFGGTKEDRIRIGQTCSTFRREVSILQAWRKMWRDILQEDSQGSRVEQMSFWWWKKQFSSASQRFESFKSRFNKLNNSVQLMSYEISRIVKTNKKVEMYDLQVPEYNNFILENNIVSHNCGCGRKGKFKLIEKILIPFQTIEILEAPSSKDETLKRLVKKKVYVSEALTRKELNNKIQPGQKVKVYGFLELEEVSKKRGRSNEFKTNIVANNLEILDTSWKSIKITKKIKGKLYEMSQSKDLLSEFSQSLAPNFEGYDLLRKSLILQHVGGKRIFDRNGNLDERGIIHILLCGDPSCQPKGSKVLMADGKFNNIEDVKIGDRIISPQEDDTCSIATVTDTTSWMCDDLYSVKSNRRKSKQLYSCSYNHLIPTYYRKRIKKGGKDVGFKREIRNFTAEEFSTFNQETTKHNKIGFTCPEIRRFETNLAPCEIEPYCLGIFIGDGSFTSNSSSYQKESNQVNITTMDKEVIEYVNEFYPYMSIHKKPKNDTNKASSYIFSLKSQFTFLLNKYGYKSKKSGDKFIPESAKYGGFEYRCKLLAGILDSDGYRSKHSTSFDYITKSKKLAEDLQFLVHSLGGIANISKCIKRITNRNFQGEYYRLYIQIDNKKIPLLVERRKNNVKGIKVSKNRIPLKVEKKNKSEMVYGIEIDSKSKLYVTDNYMVTHNSGKSHLCRKSMTLSPLWYWVQAAGTTKAGLVACISKDDYGEFTLEVGPLVMADEAILILEELDKLDKKDFGMLNNAMNDEQTKITKANIDQTLRTRTSILANSNPIHKTFNNRELVISQLKPIPKDILDRFDIIWAMRENVDEKKIAEKYMARHTKKGGNKQKWNNKEMRNYIAYARELIPILSEDLALKFNEQFSKFTGKTRDDEDTESSKSHRLRGNLLRWVYAHAKFTKIGTENDDMEIEVEEDSVNFAFTLIMASFKYLDLMNNEGIMKFEDLEEIPKAKEIDKYYFVKNKIKEVNQKYKNIVPIELIRELTKSMIKSDEEFEKIIDKLKEKGDLFEPRRGKIGLL